MNIKNHFSNPEKITTSMGDLSEYIITFKYEAVRLPLVISLIGMQEVVLILAILLLVFGPTKLPKIARELGKAINEFNKASSGLIADVTSTETSKKTSKETSNKEKKTQVLKEIADRLDLNIAGKSHDQVKDEVITKVINMKETVPTKEGKP
jgi:TatA/E family protein of Tat protein translocase